MNKIYLHLNHKAEKYQRRNQIHLLIQRFVNCNDKDTESTNEYERSGRKEKYIFNSFTEREREREEQVQFKDIRYTILSDYRP